jgi:hypothetical protein
VARALSLGKGSPNLQEMVEGVSIMGRAGGGCTVKMPEALSSLSLRVVARARPGRLVFLDQARR